jgi:hypothetical protein
MIQVGEHITLARAAGLACAGRQADRLAGRPAGSLLRCLQQAFGWPGRPQTHHPFARLLAACLWPPAGLPCPPARPACLARLPKAYEAFRLWLDGKDMPKPAKHAWVAGLDEKLAADLCQLPFTLQASVPTCMLLPSAGAVR